MSLRARLTAPEILIAPGVYDGLTATLAEQAGFEALYLSRRCRRLYAAGAARYRPDLGVGNGRYDGADPRTGRRCR